MAIDNGAMQCMVGSDHWKISKRCNSWIGVDDPVGSNSTTTLQNVDAYSTLVDDSGKCITILWLHQALHYVSLEQSLIAEGQLEYNVVKVHSHAKLLNGN